MDYIGDLIRGLRKHLKLTQRDLAAELGVQQNTISQYESGKITPSIPVLKHLRRLSEGSPYEQMLNSLLSSTDALEEDDRRRARGEPTLSTLKVQGWLQGIFDRGYREGFARGAKQAVGPSPGGVALTVEASTDDEREFLDLMLRFFRVADADMVGVVMGLASTQVDNESKKRPAKKRAS